PYEKTLQAGVFASRFPGSGLTLWTLVNRNEYGVDGEQISVAHTSGAVYFDVWNGVRVEPRIEADRAVFAMHVEARGFGAILAVAPGAQVAGLDAFLEKMRSLARSPLSYFSAEWRSLPQQ